MWLTYKTVRTFWAYLANDKLTERQLSHNFENNNKSGVNKIPICTRYVFFSRKDGGRVCLLVASTWHGLQKKKKKHTHKKQKQKERKRKKSILFGRVLLKGIHFQSLPCFPLQIYPLPPQANDRIVCCLVWQQIAIKKTPSNRSEERITTFSSTFSSSRSLDTAVNYKMVAPQTCLIMRWLSHSTEDLSVLKHTKKDRVEH